MKDGEVKIYNGKHYMAVDDDERESKSYDSLAEMLADMPCGVCSLKDICNDECMEIESALGSCSEDGVHYIEIKQ